MLAEGLEVIEAYTFAGCSAMANVTFPSTVCELTFKSTTTTQISVVIHFGGLSFTVHMHSLEPTSCLRQVIRLIRVSKSMIQQLIRCLANAQLKTIKDFAFKKTSLVHARFPAVSTPHSPSQIKPRLGMSWPSVVPWGIHRANSFLSSQIPAPDRIP